MRNLGKAYLAILQSNLAHFAHTQYKMEKRFFCLFIVNIAKRNFVSSRKKIPSWRFSPKQLLTCYIQQQNRKRTFHKSSIFSICDFFTWPTSECGDSC